MDHDASQTVMSPETVRSAAVRNMARLVAEVYGHADEELRHAVQDSFQAGMPLSVLLADSSAHHER